MILPPALFRRHPALADRIAWLPLGRFPTPLEPLPARAAERFAAPVWVKRDDVSGEPYGGNKVRKLEFLLAEARRRGARRLITVGAAGSHHALATTAYGRAQGFEVTVLLFPQPLTDHVRRILTAMHVLGAEIRYVSRMEAVPAAIWAARLAHWRERCRVVPPGGSDAVGTLGYVSAVLELAEQVESGEAARPEAVHVAAGTLGTAAGLALGFSLLGWDTRVLGTRIASRLVANEWALRKLIEGAAGILRRAGLTEVRAEDAMRRVELRHDQIGRGYGHPTEPGREAAELFASVGLTLDATYTAKAAADLLAAGGGGAAEVRLFWHTLSGLETAGVDAEVPEDALPASCRRLLAEGVRLG